VHRRRQASPKCNCGDLRVICIGAVGGSSGGEARGSEYNPNSKSDHRGQPARPPSSAKESYKVLPFDQLSRPGSAGVHIPRAQTAHALPLPLPEHRSLVVAVQSAVLHPTGLRRPHCPRDGLPASKGKGGETAATGAIRSQRPLGQRVDI
jgi:hypothetical protein